MQKYEKKTVYRAFNYPIHLHKVAHQDFGDFLSWVKSFAIADQYTRIAGTHEEKIEFLSKFFEIEIQDWDTIKIVYDAIIKILPSNPAYGSIPTDMYWRLKNGEVPKRINIQAICYYLGCRSIIGNKDFCLTNNGLVFARIFGFKSLLELQNNAPKLLKLQTRKRLGRMQKYAIDNFGLRVLNERQLGTRGFYISCNTDIDYIKYEILSKVHLKKE